MSAREPRTYVTDDVFIVSIRREARRRTIEAAFMFGVLTLIVIAGFALGADPSNWALYIGPATGALMLTIALIRERSARRRADWFGGGELVTISDTHVSIPACAAMFPWKHVREVTLTVDGTVEVVEGSLPIPIVIDLRRRASPSVIGEVNGDLLSTAARNGINIVIAQRATV